MVRALHRAAEELRDVAVRSNDLSFRAVVVIGAGGCGVRWSADLRMELRRR